jgi:23S rRNA (uracil1939-C5)-methyltransferase
MTGIAAPPMPPAEPGLTVEIDRLSYGPYGIGRRGGRVVLVPLTAPGDEVEVRLVEAKKNFATGELARILRSSPARREPPCAYFGRCGGCAWQHVSYRAQLEAKERSVKDALERIGKLEGFDLLPIVPSSRPLGYRHRIRLRPSADGLGYFRAGSHEVVTIESCAIAEPKINARLADAREFARGLRTPLEWLELAAAADDRVALVARAAKASLHPADEAFVPRYLERHPAIKGTVVSGKGWRRLWGEPTLVLPLADGMALSVAADVFTQVNLEASVRVCRELLDWGGFEGADLVELYSGAGNFTLPLARRCRSLVAVERDRHAVESGRQNAARCGLENIEWVHSDVAAALGRLRAERRRFSHVVLDPPRAGAKTIVPELAALQAEKILYVSCDPPTLARDLGALAAAGYRLRRVRPFDLFPQTFHVETLAELARGEPPPLWPGSKSA